MQTKGFQAEPIPKCLRCGRPSTALSPRTGEPVELRQCCGCDQRVYVQERTGGYPDMHPQSVASRGFRPYLHLATQRPTSVERLVVAIGQLDALHELNERRLSPRLAVALPISATPLDERFMPMGRACGGATVDLCASGMAFVLPSAVHAVFWLLDFGPAGHRGYQSIVKPVRCEPIDGSCWKIAGPLVTALDEPRNAETRFVSSHSYGP